MSFDDYLVKLPRQKQLEFPCKIWKPSIKAAGAKVGLTMVGEFSIATNDCGKFLNGVGMGARFDGTLEPLEEGVSPPGTCVDQDNWKNYTSEYNQFLKTFMEKQMDSYEGSIGWFYWTYKTQDHINPLWDYLLAYEQGWAPKDANVRDTHCPAVTSNKIKEEEEE